MVFLLAIFLLSLSKLLSHQDFIWQFLYSFHIFLIAYYWSSSKICMIEPEYSAHGNFLEKKYKPVALFSETNVVISTPSVSSKVRRRAPLWEAKGELPARSESQSLEGRCPQGLPRASFAELGSLLQFTRWHGLEAGAEDHVRLQSPTFIIIRDGVHEGKGKDEDFEQVRSHGGSGSWLFDRGASAPSPEWGHFPGAR